MDIVLIRHGESEANLINQKNSGTGDSRFFSGKTEVILDSRLRERSLGEFEGKYVRDVQNQERYRKYFTDPAFMAFRHDFLAKAPGGENYQDVCNRVEEFLYEIQKLNLKK